MTPKKSRPKRRIRSPHPGVVIMQPDASHAYYRARFKEPDTGRVVKVKIDPLAVTTVEARREWAIAKAKSLAKRRMDIESGAPKQTGTALKVAIERYFDAHGGLRKRTEVIYRTAANKLLTWSEKAAVTSADDLNRARLIEFREWLVKQRKRVAVSGEGKGRGKFASSGEQRSPAAINQDIRAVLTVLRYVCDLDLFPKLTHDDLRRALKRVPVTTDRIEFLSAAECAQLVEAALLHDAETFTETRDEHAGKRPVGTTPRYSAIAPFVFALLCTGMRFGEAVTLTWKQVDLDALDVDGRPVGEIHLSSDVTKTKRPRTIMLDVCPALRALLVQLHAESRGKGKVFKLTRGEADAAINRLRETYGAPTFTWQMLRRTTGTYLTNAPGIFGSASAYQSARQLGHSVAVAEKAYLGVLRGIPREARTIEAAMQLEKVVAKLLPGEQESEAAQ